MRGTAVGYLGGGRCKHTDLTIGVTEGDIPAIKGLFGSTRPLLQGGTANLELSALRRREEPTSAIAPWRKEISEMLHAQNGYFRIRDDAIAADRENLPEYRYKQVSEVPTEANHTGLVESEVLAGRPPFRRSASSHLRQTRRMSKCATPTRYTVRVEAARFLLF